MRENYLLHNTGSKRFAKEGPEETKEMLGKMEEIASRSITATEWQAMEEMQRPVPGRAGFHSRCERVSPLRRDWNRMNNPAWLNTMPDW